MQWLQSFPMGVFIFASPKNCLKPATASAATTRKPVLFSSLEVLFEEVCQS